MDQNNAEHSVQSRLILFIQVSPQQKRDGVLVHNQSDYLKSMKCAKNMIYGNYEIFTVFQIQLHNGISNRLIGILLCLKHMTAAHALYLYRNLLSVFFICSVFIDNGL